MTELDGLGSISENPCPRTRKRLLEEELVLELPLEARRLFGDRVDG